MFLCIWSYEARPRMTWVSTCLDHFGASVSFWGQTTSCLSCLFPELDRGLERIKSVEFVKRRGSIAFQLTQCSFSQQRTAARVLTKVGTLYCSGGSQPDVFRKKTPWMLFDIIGNLNVPLVGKSSAENYRIPPVRKSALMTLLTLLELQSHFGDNPIKFQVVCPQIGTAALKGLRLQSRFGDKPLKF